MLENEIQTSLEICKSHLNLYAKNIEMVMIMHKSLLFFIFIFASWTDPLQFLGQASQGDLHTNSGTIASNPSHHI